MTRIGRTRIRSFGVAAALGLALATLCLAVPSARAAHAAASPRISFYFGLRRPEAQARRMFFAVQQPGSASYRRFLTPRQVAARYGASSSVRARFVRDIRRYGFSVRIDPSGVFARVSGSVALFQRVFKVRITQGMGDNPPVLTYGTTKPLRLPSDLRPLVQDVVTSYLKQVKVSASHVAAAGPLAVTSDSGGPTRTGTWTGGCAQAEATGAFSYDQVRDAYGIDQLGTGAGASIAILGLTEMPSARDIADNARCFAYQKLRSRTLLTDGETLPVPTGLFEPQEDLALARGMAPDASLIFTQAWSGSDLWFLGAAQVLDGRQLPESFSISYGICENDVRGNGPDVTPSTRAGANLLDSVLVRLGLAGVGTYASAGDSGSSCNGLPYSGVAWPASSPYLTAVGGTQLTLTPSNQRLDEVVWNDLKWTPASEGGGAGGGGFSLKSARPPFQRGLGLSGNRRAVPDVSAAASSFPGWPVVLGGHWTVDGGTSAAAPLVAAAMAVVSVDLQRQHLPPVGPADGLFYYLARCRPSAFFDVVKGNNGFLRKVPARYADPGYDLASGLGVPQFAQIAQLIPPPGAAAPAGCAAPGAG
ncbi:MAG TPA: protease pro-enzyme activation domain-containing protein [Solirubrobacteraceae bacterium]|nr:protease pro-enzyme activation domain-containing protein [Solirubrobacteraceae bacterium]